MRQAILLVAAVVVVGTVAGIPVVTSAENPAVPGVEAIAQAQSANVSNNVAPGERLSGVIGVQEAEFEGEFEQRRFSAQISSAASNSAKAGVLKAQLVNSRQRLNELEREKHRLQQARANGSISQGRFQAEMARLAARTQTVNQLANVTDRHSRRLPQAALEAKGVNRTAITRLQRDARNLSGPEVAAIARSIAGRSIGPRAGGGRPGNVGPPSERGPPGQRGHGGPNASPSADDETATAEAERALRRADRRVTTARDQVARARQTVNQTNASGEALEALATAETKLSAAESALADAQAALEAGDVDEAIELADAAVEQAETAVEAAREARSSPGNDEHQPDDNGSEREPRDDGDGDNDDAGQQNDGSGPE